MAIQQFKTDVPCLVCGKEDYATLCSIRRDKTLVDLKADDPSIRYVVCKPCGLVFQNPRITHEVEVALYTEGQYRGFSKNPRPEWLENHFRFSEQEVKWISGIIGTPSNGKKRALEIGAGVGFGVRALERLGWKAVGVEPDQDLAALGRTRYGLDIRGEFFTEETFPGETFSLIFTYQVFEHLLDPLEILQTARRKVEPDGYLFINAPTYRRCDAKLTWLNFASPHISIFTHKTLGNLLARAGFKLFKFEYQVDGMLRILATPSEVSEEILYKDNWRLVPLEIAFQGLKYFLTRAFPRNTARGIKAMVYTILGRRVGEVVVKSLIRMKQRLGIHFY